MDNGLIINMITKDSKEIESIIAEFGKYQTIPQILIDLTQSKIKNLYTEVQMLNKTEEQLHSVQLLSDSGEKPQKKLAEIPNGVIATEEVHIEPITLQQEVLTPEMKISKREAHLLSTQLKFDSIKDLKSSIEINKKIWFNKELFGGNIDNFNKTIDVLNNMKDLHEVLEYIDTNFDWNIDDKTVRDFMEFIYRRYF